MAFVFANRGLYTLLNSAISGSTDLRCLVGTSAQTAYTDAAKEDLNTVADYLASQTEAANTNYARQDLASVTLTEDDTNNRVAFTAAAPTMNSVAAGGSAWRDVVYYIEGASDSARNLIGIDAPSSTLTPNGGNVTLPAFTAYVTDTSA